MKTVDLFCGAGGSSSGAQLAGARIVGAVDADPLAVATFGDNFPDAKVVQGRLDECNGVELIGDVGQVDLLLASPECTNHSVARGARKIDTASLESGLFILPFIRTWKPKFLVLENVSRMQRWQGWDGLLRQLHQCGYGYRITILSAHHFGVPQTRRRMFLIASQDADPPPEIQAPVRCIRSVAEILDPRGKHLAKSVYHRPRPLAQATIERIERGRRALSGGEDFIIVYYSTDAAGGWQPLDRPLRTLTTLDRFGLVSGTGDETTLRMLQVSELKRAMGFPDTFQFDRGTRRDRIRLIGNAVCPPVMQAIVESLKHTSNTGLTRCVVPQFETEEET